MRPTLDLLVDLTREVRQLLAVELALARSCGSEEV